jgi:hypothetical protein
MTMNKAQFQAIPENERIRVLEGTCYWGHLQRPDMNTARRFNSTPNYHLSLALSDEQADLAREYGLKVHDANDSIPQPYVKIKRRVKDESNPEASKPDLVDSVQNTIPSNILVGNGSKVRAKFGTYWYDAQGGGVGTSLFKVQVLDLVEYSGGGGAGGLDSDFAVDDSGWTVSSGDTVEDGGFVADEKIFDTA